MLVISILLNTILAIALVVAIISAKRAIRKEKLATFASCLRPLSYSLLSEQHDQRFELAAFELAGVVGRTDDAHEGVLFYLTRAAFIRPFRSAALVDVGGEYTRLLALQTAGTDGEEGNRILEYIGQSKIDEQGREIEPRDFFGEEALVTAQLVAERKLLDYYASEIAKRNFKIFLGS